MFSGGIATLKVACLLDADINSGGTAKTAGMPDAALRAYTLEIAVLIVRMRRHLTWKLRSSCCPPLPLPKVKGIAL